jgi:hypothetical protein
MFELIGLALAVLVIVGAWALIANTTSGDDP